MQCAPITWLNYYRSKIVTLTINDELTSTCSSAEAGVLVESTAERDRSVLTGKSVAFHYSFRVLSRGEEKESTYLPTRTVTVLVFLRKKGNSGNPYWDINRNLFINRTDRKGYVPRCSSETDTIAILYSGYEFLRHMLPIPAKVHAINASNLLFLLLNLHPLLLPHPTPSPLSL